MEKKLQIKVISFFAFLFLEKRRKKGDYFVFQFFSILSDAFPLFTNLYIYIYIYIRSEEVLLIFFRVFGNFKNA